MKRFGNYYISSKCTIYDFMDTLTEETDGNCLGPADFVGDFYEERKQEIVKNFDSFLEIEKEEENERIYHLSREWGLEESDLEYLR